jgi:hypothetical protein
MRRALLASWIVSLGCAFMALACEDDLVEDYDLCASGKRWIGGRTPSEEMYPGHDCVGCHQEYGGPEFLAAGTIYGLLDQDGSRTIDHDCFGVEGARVTITTGDGQVLETLTNRAGNFYFEGRASSFVTPFRVVVDYELEGGGRSRQPMSSNPSYGGCARCHSIHPTGTLGAEPGNVLAPDEIVQGVLPIFTGPVHQVSGPDAGSLP